MIVREDLLGRSPPVTPSAFDYGEQAAADSMLNTPPTYAIYIAGTGVQSGSRRAAAWRRWKAHNRAKAALLYDYLDSQDFFSSPIDKNCRSLMNVPFRLRATRRWTPSSSRARRRAACAAQGHRVVGGMRASIYNAMPIEGVQALVGT